MKNRIFLLPLLMTVLLALPQIATAQPAWTIDLLGKEKKPEQFEERKLGSEKMAEKKFTKVRRFFQNTYTHYNYFYNANNKINGVLERAKAAQADDYSTLLPYFPYSLANTAAQTTELDSVIYKATAGILLHDLRNDWIDNMYLLMGKAYFLKKEFDSAAATFQFINYNLFPRKKDEDDSRIVGTRDDAAGNSISIANKEKRNFVQKIVSKPPSRNDALVWLALTLTEQGEMGEAAGLINTLQNDPNLPPRLHDDLNDVTAYWFYKQNIFDSTVVYMENALSNAENKQDLARAEFLLAQLYERIGNFEKASLYYNKASAHTTLALMDIYAQLNNAKMRRSDNEKELDRGISNLTHLARKDKFENYRDLIYYSAGDLALQKPDTSAAIAFFLKSLKYPNETNPAYKNRALVQLGDIAYNRKEYKDAYNYYDSLQSGDTSMGATLKEIQARRNALSDIVEKIYTIEREDSLQRIASLPIPERDAFVKKLSKKLRKERGLKEEDNNSGSELISFDSQQNQPVDLFAGGGTKNSEWYFYNSALKSKGLTEFKRKWGTRTNTDNWRRKSALAIATANNSFANTPDMSGNPDGPDLDLAAPPNNMAAAQNDKGANTSKANDAAPGDVSFEALMSNLPISPERMTESNNLVAVSLFELAKLYQNKLEDYQQAIYTYENSLQRFPDSLYNGELYFGLLYCYGKTGNQAKADYYKKLIAQKFAGSRSAQLLNNPDAAKPGQKNKHVTKQYEAVYNLFIEGNFEAAITEKKKADSLYGNSFWTPQLLYIEAVYYVKQKEDSAAIAVLNNISSLYPQSALKPKAERMIDVLGRRKEIEEYLANLNITRYSEDEIVIKEERPRLVRNDSNLIVSPKPKLIDSTAATLATGAAALAPAINTPDIVAQTQVPVATVAPKPAISGPYVFNAAAPHQVVMLLNKVDITYVNESRNAFARYTSDKYRGAGITVNREKLDNDLSLVLFAPFADAAEALQFLTKEKKAAPDEVSWLPANKYSFILIDNDNLERLRNTKDVASYITLLQQNFPGWF